jgi:hypothetical protein
MKLNLSFRSYPFQQSIQYRIEIVDTKFGPRSLVRSRESAVVLSRSTLCEYDPFLHRSHPSIDTRQRNGSIPVHIDGRIEKHALHLNLHPDATGYSVSILPCINSHTSPLAASRGSVRRGGVKRSKLHDAKQNSTSAHMQVLLCFRFDDCELSADEVGRLLPPTGP